MRRKIHRILAMFLAAFLVCGSLGGMSVSAEDAVQTTAGQWKASGNYYYYYQDGIKLTGVRQIGANTYYFSQAGKQITGWRKIGSDYYFFNIANGAGGFMVRNKKVNGVRLGADGKAGINKKRARRKVRLMARCAVMMDKVTKPGQSKSKKLKIAFKYAKKHYPRRNIHHWRKSKDWDLYYAEYIINHRSGDCYCQGALMAYLANAVGYSKVFAVSSGGHGWAMVDGKVYDPNWSFIIGDSKCYAVKRSQNGRGGRPPWFTASKYKKDLRK